MRATIPETSFLKPDDCWLSAPPESSPDYLAAFSGISVAVQTELRHKVPSAFFENTQRFEDRRKAFPMLLYQASRPFRRRVRTNLTYDVLNPIMIAKILKRSKKSLSQVLAPIEARLQAEGLTRLASVYRPSEAGDIIRAVERLDKSRRCLLMLLRGEGVLVDALVSLGGLGSLPAKARDRCVVSFGKRWALQLRHLFPRTDYTWLAPILMDRATEALRAFLSTSPAGASVQDNVGRPHLREPGPRLV